MENIYDKIGIVILGIAIILIAITLINIEKRFDSIEEKLETMPKWVCYNETIIEEIELNKSNQGVNVEGLISAMCGKGVIIEDAGYYHWIIFDVYEYCGLPLSSKEELLAGDYSDENTEFWDAYFKCKNEAKKNCTIKRKEEICEII